MSDQTIPPFDEPDFDTPAPDAPAPAPESGGALPGFSVEGEGRAPEPAGPSDGEAPGFVQVFVNVGKREGVQPSQLEELLRSGGLASDDVGRVRVRDRMSFVSVRNEALARATAILGGQVIGGRTVIAELARARS